MTTRIALFTSILHILLHLAGSASWAADVVAVKGLDIRPYNEAIEGFRDACNCSVEELTLPENSHADIARRVLDKNPEAVLAVGIDALEHLQVIRNVPVLYAMVPSALGIPSSAVNISGVSTYISADKYLAAIAEVAPQAQRIGVIYDPRNSERLMQEASSAAAARGLQLVARKVGRAAEVPQALEGLRDRADLIWMAPDATVINAEAVKQMLLFSFQNRVPVFTFSRKFVEMGAVAAISVLPYDMGAQAGEMAARLLRDRQAGGRVAPRKTVLVINGKVARKLGLRLRDDVVRKAEDVGR